MKTKLLLDTDIGSDIDDALALAYLLAQPRCELLGVTTVGGRTDVRASLVSALCRHAGKDVPIFPGAGAALMGPPNNHYPPQAAVLPNWPHETEFPVGEAVEFLRATIRRYAHEVTLLAIGPLTNVALLFRVDPEIPALLKGLVLMCGIFTRSLHGAATREWNALCDPEATSIVYGATVAQHRSIGLDVTMQVEMNREEMRRRLSHDRLKPVLDMTEVFFEKQKARTCVYHDPLAAATIFDDGICRFAKGLVEVELTSARLKGLTYWQPQHADARHEVAVEVDVPRFIEHYFSVFA